MKINKINKFNINLFLLIFLSFSSENNCFFDLSSFFTKINRRMDNYNFGWNFNTVGYAFKNFKKKIEENPKKSLAVGGVISLAGFIYYFKYRKNNNQTKTKPAAN